MTIEVIGAEDRSLHQRDRGGGSFEHMPALHPAPPKGQSDNSIH